MPKELKKLLPNLGLIFLFSALLLALIAYYSHYKFLNVVSFFSLSVALLCLCLALFFEIRQRTHSTAFTLGVTVAITLLYFSLRFILHRFDFSIGDPSDYYLAGICSITYGQDIGYFLPLTASVSAVGFTIFGLEYAPYINTVLHFANPLLLFLLLQRLGISIITSLIIVFGYLILPLDIWFSSSSFSDPMWQLFVLAFIFLWVQLFQTNQMFFANAIALFLLLFLAPFLRGEAILLYALMMPLLIYYYHVTQNFKNTLFLAGGLIVMGVAIAFTLHIRSNYLIHTQFKRIYSDITIDVMQYVLTIFAAMCFVFLLLYHRAYSKNQHIRLAPIFVSLSIIFKIAITYYYTQKYSLSFFDFLVGNEIGFSLGNFGIFWSVLIYIGLILLYYRAYRDDPFSLIAILVYTLFSIPFMMQKVTFYDPHAILFYWNRYYLSALLVIHLLSLALLLDIGFKYLQKLFSTSMRKYISVAYITIFLGLLIFSIPMRLFKIVMTEPHQPGSYHLVPWLKTHIGKHPVSVIYDSSAIYEQNKGHIGLYDIKHLISRVLTVFKVNAKDYVKVKPNKLNTSFVPKYDLSKRDYLLCVSKSPCELNQTLFEPVDTLVLPLSWREHFTLPAHHSKHMAKSLVDSYLNQWNLYFELYKITSKAKTTTRHTNPHTDIVFTQHNKNAEKLLHKGWKKIVGNVGALSYQNSMTLLLSHLKPTHTKSHNYITLALKVLTASKQSPVHLQFHANNKLIRQIIINSAQTRMIRLRLPRNTRTVLLKISGSPIDTKKDFHMTTVLKSVTIVQ